MSLDTKQYKELFVEEAKEHLDTLTKSLLVLEKEPDNSEVINMFFRSAHTLKGSSGMMGYKDFQQLTHAMEDAFDGMRKGNKPPSKQISVLLECVDELSARLENIQNGAEGEINVAKFIGKLYDTLKTAPEKQKLKASESATNVESASIEFSKSENEMIRKAEASGERCYKINVRFSDDCVFKSIRAQMVLDKLEKLADVVKTVPRQEDLTEEKLAQGFIIFVTGKSENTEIAKTVEQVLEVEKVEVTPFDCNIQQTKTVKPTGQQAEDAKLMAEVRSAQTVRVKFEQLDNLMNLVGELVISKIALLEVAASAKNESLRHIAENIHRLTASLQSLIMQVRMVPVSQVFDRFPRLVRDLSLKKSKKINLVMEGREIEVDRTLLDEIGEPLIHLLRNCVDHGIELPEERLKQGKSETGTIKLVTRPADDHIIIEVEDDGAGINPEKVKKTALEKKLISETEVAHMTQEQLVNLICLPGLSTAKEVTETSGRGVGMDVVKTKIAALGGKVQIETCVGKGTKISLRLPSTLTIIKALLVKDSDQVFAIPTSQVSEVVSVKRKDIASLGTFRAIQVRGKVVPLLHFHSMLNLQGGMETESLEVLIVYGSGEDQKIGVAVDSVIGLQEILIKPLDGMLKRIKGYRGVTLLGNGTVVLVVDLNSLIIREFEREKTIAYPEASLEQALV